MLGNPIMREVSANGYDVVLWDHSTDREYTIMAYPKAKFSCGSCFGPKRGEKFCLPLNVGLSGEEIFSQLVNGTVDLPDLWQYFHEPSKHAFALGMIEREDWNRKEYLEWKARRDER